MEDCVMEKGKKDKPATKPKPRGATAKPSIVPLLSSEDVVASRNGSLEVTKKRGVSGGEKSDHSSPTTPGGDLIEALLNHNKRLDESLSRCDAEMVERKRAMEELQAQLDDLRTVTKSMDTELEELASNNAGHEDILEEVEKYLVTYERLRADEKLFKQSCNEEMERLQKELDSMDTDFSDTTKADLLAQIERNRARLEAGKIELATINRQVASIRRQIEQVPNRMELKEYRLRFSELYNQVSATHRSTKQFFSLYNSLEDTKRYLEKELSLLNSIVDSYQLACTSSSGREEFLRQLQSINESMKDTGSKVEKRYQTDRFSVDTLQAEIQRLLDVKVAYEKCILELEAECRKNDQLLAECKAVEGEVKPVVQNQGSSSGESDND